MTHNGPAHGGAGPILQTQSVTRAHPWLHANISNSEHRYTRPCEPVARPRRVPCARQARRSNTAPRFPGIIHGSRTLPSSRRAATPWAIPQLQPLLRQDWEQLVHAIANNWNNAWNACSPTITIILRKAVMQVAAQCCTELSIPFTPHLARIRSISQVPYLAAQHIGHPVESIGHTIRAFLEGEQDPEAYEITVIQLRQVMKTIATQLIQYRHAMGPKPRVALRRCTSWNLTSWTRPTMMTKLRKKQRVKAAFSQGPLLLQETKWDMSQPMTTAIMLGRAEVFSTPAIDLQGTDTEGGDPADEELHLASGRSGGVAILLPTYLTNRATAFTTLVPGYVIQTTMRLGGCVVNLVSYYLRVGEEDSILKRWKEAWERQPPEGVIYAGGDRNHPSDQEWTRFLANFALLDVTPTGLKTFANQSCLDRWLIRDLDYEHSRIRCSCTARGVQGASHALVTLNMALLPAARKALPAYQAIPKECFLQTEAAQRLQVAMYYWVQERGLTQAMNPMYGEADPCAANITWDNADIINTPVPVAHLLLDLTSAIWAWYWALPSTKNVKPPRAILETCLRVGGSHIPVPQEAVKQITANMDPKPDLSRIEPLGNGNLNMPTSLLHTILECDEQRRAIDEAVHSTPARRKSIFNPKTNPALWGEARKLTSTRFVPLRGLYDHQGKFQVTPQKIADAARATRPFWTEEPVGMGADQLAFLHNYMRSTTAFPRDMQPPTPYQWMKIVTHTKDGGPGRDGIPYKFYQQFPRLTCVLLAALTSQLADPLIEAPSLIQLLVWIPKADFALYADAWRPLGLPTTFHRIQALGMYTAIVSQVKQVLHPGQALLNHFKEPQGNVLAALDHLDQHQQDMESLGLALLTDCVKGFELVNPHWIIAVLKAKRVPNWLLAYVRFVLFDRQVMAKILGQQVPAIFIRCGVDMGSGLSPLLFCMALDPLIELQHRIPQNIFAAHRVFPAHCKVRLQQFIADTRRRAARYGIDTIHRMTTLKAYMDDNIVLIESLLQLAITQFLYTQFQPMGFQMVQHNCCSFSPSCGPLGEEQQQQANPAALEGVDTQGIDEGISWHKAAKDALAAHPHATSFAAAHCEWLLSRQELQQLQSGHAPELISALVDAGCKCKTKTAIVPARQLKPQEVAFLDLLPWGAMIIRTTAVALGLPLVCPVTHALPIHRGRKAQGVQGGSLTQYQNLAVRKCNCKIIDRCRMLKLVVTPLTANIQYTSAYVASTSYYNASVALSSAAQQNFMMNQISHVLVGKYKWIAREHMISLFQYTQVGQGTDIGLAHALACVGLALRQHGASILNTNKVDLARQSGWLKKRVLEALETLVPHISGDAVSPLFALAAHHPNPSPKNARAILSFLKAHIAQQGFHKTEQYLERRTAGIYWNTGGLMRGLRALHTLPRTAIKSQFRLAMVRWLLDAEADDTLQYNKHGPGPCGICACGCSKGSLLHPLGRGIMKLHQSHVAHTPIWELHLDAPSTIRLRALKGGRTYEADKNLDRLRQLLPVAPGSPHHLAMLQSANSSLCPLCRNGECTVEHWMHFCPVTNLTLALILGRSTDFNDWTPDEDVTEDVAHPDRWPGRAIATGKNISLIAHLVFVIRMELTARQAYGHNKYAAPIPRHDTHYDTAIELLGTLQSSHYDIGLSAAYGNLAHLPPQRCSCECCHVQPKFPPALNALPAHRKRTSRPVLAAAHTMEVGDTMWITHKPKALQHGAYANSVFLPPPRAVVDITDLPNATVQLAACPQCGQQTTCLVAATHLREGDPILIGPWTNTVRQTKAVIIQFDGSCHFAATSDASAGAGVAAFCIPGNGAVIPITSWAVPLPHATDAALAEAGGADFAVSIAIQLVDDYPPSAYQYIIQGDNISVITYMQGNARFQSLLMHQALETAKLHVSLYLNTLLFEYLPREANKIADALAGIASKAILEARARALPLPLPAPHQEVVFPEVMDMWDTFTWEAFLSGSANGTHVSLPTKMRRQVLAQALATSQRQTGWARHWPYLLSCCAGRYLTVDPVSRGKSIDTYTHDVLGRLQAKHEFQVAALPFALLAQICDDHYLVRFDASLADYMYVAIDEPRKHMFQHLITALRIMHNEQIQNGGELQLPFVQFVEVWLMSPRLWATWMSSLAATHTAAEAVSLTIQVYRACTACETEDEFTVIHAFCEWLSMQQQKWRTLIARDLRMAPPPCSVIPTYCGFLIQWDDPMDLDIQGLYICPVKNYMLSHIGRLSYSLWDTELWMPPQLSHRSIAVAVPTEHSKAGDKEAVLYRKRLLGEDPDALQRYLKRRRL